MVDWKDQSEYAYRNGLEQGSKTGYETGYNKGYFDGISRVVTLVEKLATELTPIPHNDFNSGMLYGLKTLKDQVKLFQTSLLESTSLKN